VSVQWNFGVNKAPGLKRVFHLMGGYAQILSGEGLLMGSRRESGQQRWEVWGDFKG